MLLFFQFFLSFSLSFSCSTSDGSNATVSTLLQKKARTGLTLSMLNLQSLAMWWSTWWGSICTSQRFQWHFLIYFNLYNYLSLSAGFTCNSGWQVLFVPVCQMYKTMFNHDWKRANLPFSACYASSWWNAVTSLMSCDLNQQITTDCSFFSSPL